MHSTSGCAYRTHASTRSSRAFNEFTFHVAIRTAHILALGDTKPFWARPCRYFGFIAPNCGCNYLFLAAAFFLAGAFLTAAFFLEGAAFVGAFLATAFFFTAAFFLAGA